MKIIPVYRINSLIQLLSSRCVHICLTLMHHCPCRTTVCSPDTGVCVSECFMLLPCWTEHQQRNNRSVLTVCSFTENTTPKYKRVRKFIIHVFSGKFHMVKVHPHIFLVAGSATSPKIFSIHPSMGSCRCYHTLWIFIIWTTNFDVVY